MRRPGPTNGGAYDGRHAEDAMSPHIATADTVGREELLDFVRSRHHLVLVTTKRDGSAQLSPVTGGLDDEGRVVIATYPERAKTHNARRHPKVDVLVLSDDFGGAWVQLRGTDEILDLPEAVERWWSTPVDRDEHDD
jgi:PPOX class probable F420-dependent enzyme